MADPVGVLVNIAIQAAISLAIAALTPKQHTEGPRLDDLGLTTSTYGVPIPIGYANSLLPGNIIWGRQIREEGVTVDIGKGNPFSAGTQTLYYYYATFAVAICDRQVGRLVRIYADGKLIYAQDIDDPEEMTDLSYRFHSGGPLQEPDPIMASHFPAYECPAYRGIAYIVFNDLPLANFGNRIPQFQFAVSFATTSGPRMALPMKNPNYPDSPAFLGSYDQVVFDRERNIVYAAAGTGTVSPYSPHYIAALSGSTGEVLQSITTAELNLSIPNPGVGGGGGDAPYIKFSTTIDFKVLVGGLGPYLVASMSTSLAGLHVVLNKNTFAVVGRSAVPWNFNTASGNYINFAFDHWVKDFVWEDGKYAISSSGACMIAPVSFIGGVKYFFVGGGSGQYTRSFDPDSVGDADPYFPSSYAPRGMVNVASLPDLVPLTGRFNEPVADDGTTQIWEYSALAMTLGRRAEGYTDVYVATRTEETLAAIGGGSYTAFGRVSIIRVRIAYDGTVANYVMRPEGNVFANPYFDLTDYQTPTLRYDPGSDTLVVIGKGYVDGATQPLINVGFFMNSNLADDIMSISEMRKLWENSEYTMVRTDTRDPIGGNAWSGFFPVKTIGTSVSAGRISMVDAATGEIIQSYNFGNNAVNDSTGDTYFWDGTTHIYDEKRNRILNLSGGSFFGWFPLGTGVARGVESLQSVVNDILVRTKLTPDLWDTSALEAIDVNGYTLSREVSYRAALEPLATGYNFYAVEKDGMLVFLIKNAATTRSLTKDDMVTAGAGSPAFEESRTQEAELPRAVYLEYMSKQFTDDKLVQGVRRPVSPNRVMGAVGEIRMQLPLTLGNSAAMTIAKRVMYETWVGQERMKFKLGQKYLDLLPNDVLEVSADERVENVRLDSVDVGADLSLEVEGHLIDGEVYEEALTYVDTDPRTGRSDTVINTEVALAIGFLLDLPLLQDSYGQNRDAGSVMYFVAGPPAGKKKFNGAGLLTSTYGGLFANRTSVSTAMAWGIIRGGFPDRPGPDWNGVQEAAVSVSVVAGPSYFSGVTQADMIGNDANSAVLYDPLTGQTEIIGFRDATNVTVDLVKYTRIKGFMRGKRGTDTRGYDWGNTVYIIILNSAWIASFLESNSLNNANVHYTVTPVGTVPNYADITALQYHHEGLKPYAPCHVVCAMASGNAVISWTRRTRQGGSLRNNTGSVPLAEDSEEYAIEILSGAGGSVIRTLEVAAVTTITYTAAVAAGDFGSMPNPLYVKVYQKSAQVIRGFTNEIALATE